MPSSKLLRQWLGLALGAGLLIAAVIIALRSISMQQLANADPRLVLMIVPIVVGNLYLGALVFQIITQWFYPQPPVTLRKMFALICASSLLNYLPMRPGMLGRAAYLKWAHKLPLTASALTAVIVFVISLILLLTIGVAAALVDLGSLLVVSAVALLVLSLVIQPLAAQFLPRARKLLVAGKAHHSTSDALDAQLHITRPRGAVWLPGIRMLDLLLASVRLYLAFQIVGAPITPVQAVLGGCAGVLVVLAGVTPNGLGLREVVLGAIFTSIDPTQNAAAMAAVVIERGIEVLVVVPLGVWAIRHLKPAESAQA